MRGRSRIIAFGTDARDAAAGDELLLTAALADDAGAPAPPEVAVPAWPEPGPVAHAATRDWLAPGLASLGVLGWTGFFAWAIEARLRQPSAPADWAGWIAEWATPVLLIGVVWLLAMRISRRETTRYADAARGLADASASLETRLLTVNRELSLAREFLASQSRDLETLGRLSVERISGNAERLHALIGENGARLDAIGSVSEVALENMEKLRGQLPVIANAAKDVTNNIGNAGRSAQAQLENLVSGFNRLNEFGLASERQVDRLRGAFEAAGEEFTRRCDAFGRIADQHFAALRERGDELRDHIEGQETAALAALRARAETMNGEFDRARELLDHQEAETLVSLRARIAAIRDEGGAIARSLRDGEDAASDAWRRNLDAMSERIADMDERLARLHETNADRMAAYAGQTEVFAGALAASGEQIATLAGTAETASRTIDSTLGRANDLMRDSTARLGEIEATLPGLTEASIRLFELIHASAEEGRARLPESLAMGEARLVALDQRARDMREAIAAASVAGEALSGSLDATRASLAALTREVEALHLRLDAATGSHTDELAGIRDMLASVERDSNRLAEQSRGELSAALRELQDASRAAIGGLGNASAPALSAFADNLARESAAAIDRAMRQSAAETAGKLEQAAAHAAGVSHEAAIQLRDQLLKVDELAGNLETRVSQVRERAREQVDNDFARRAALITEALNSGAIDISKALSTEVADTAWAAYLRGDRGIFTRRAVSLLDNAQGRAVSQIYETDREFRAHVSRYIHDFEAMLRQVLSTRDGHALGVTLLSSDMGKLYVALAQAIERLRA